MLDSISIGTSGLLGHAKGLKIVGNNLANVNTPGFKGSEMQFANLFDQGGTGGQQKSQSTAGNLGSGLNTLGSKINFKAGTDQGTGNVLDLAINGNGFYTVKREGEIMYTRAGDFEFNEKDVLVNSQGDHVQGLDAQGRLVDITRISLTGGAGKATTVVKMAGNLKIPAIIPPATTSAIESFNGITVFDSTGASRTIDLAFVSNSATGNDYTVTVTSDGVTLGTGHLKFAAGLPTAPDDKIAFTFPVSASGVPAFTATLDFSQGVNATVADSTLKMASQDGLVKGTLVNETISENGTLKLNYSNGTNIDGARLALASFASDRQLVEAGGSMFTAAAASTVTYGHADSGAFGKLAAGHREGSNIDLAAEFGNLILMQRGYQASSHVISTANDMIQQLFDMKGNR